MSMKVCLSPSGQPTNGCAWGDSEKDHCNQLAKLMIPLLNAKGIACRVRGSQSITSFANEANAWGADLYLPMHTNAYNGKVQGSRFGYYIGRVDSKAKCSIFIKHMKTIYPWPVKMSVYEEFLEARVPRMPSVYCELVFHDCLADAQWFHANMDLIAQTLVNAIAECGESEMIPAPTPVPVPTPEPTKPEVVIMQAKVITVNPNSLNLWEAQNKKRSLKLIPRGAIVNVLQEVNATWAKIEYEGITGYVDRQYLEAVVGPAVPTVPPVIPVSDDITITLSKSLATALKQALDKAV